MPFKKWCSTESLGEGISTAMCQEIDNGKTLVELFGIEVNTTDAQELAAVACGTSASGILLTILTSENMLAPVKKRNISLALKKMREQSAAFAGCKPVEKRVHDTIFSAATRFALQ